MVHSRYVNDDDPLPILAALLLSIYTLLEFVPLGKFTQGSTARYLLWSAKITSVIVGTLLYVGSRVHISLSDLWGWQPAGTGEAAIQAPLTLTAAGIFTLLALAYVLTWKKRIGEDAGDSVLGAVFATIFYLKKALLTSAVMRTLAVLGIVCVFATVFA